MGNSQAKETRPGSSRGHRPSSTRHGSSPPGPGGSSHERSGSGVYGSRSGRGSRHDLSFLGLGGGSSERDPALEPRRETKAEREARKLEKERALRAQERERSIREEGVDGGYLVTLGTYTGPEDFSKPIVRQLQIERRLAPFWKGLNDHSDSWTEYQLVAVVNGLPLPAPDEIPPEEPPRPTNANNNLSTDWSPRGSNTNINSLTVPISARSMSQGSDRSSTLSPSHPAFSLPSPTSPISAPATSTTFFRGRAKTLASLATGSRNASQTEMAPQETQLPKDPYVNGQRVEVFLYKNAEECPICFLYYPPYLNKTRCCDQPICSECFVQIKRPDPHPPEHHDDPSNPPAEPQEENLLVSEPSACPFCVQPEFGVTYEPPPFRRGLVYANSGHHPLVNAASAMSSTSSVNSQGVTSPGRRRATSLAANDRAVITTDMVRPDWAKKLADARAHALRRAAAATALHNAAYMMGNLQSEGRSFGGLGRRRRTMFGNDSPSSSGQGTPRREADSTQVNAGSSRNEGQNDLPPGRHSSRRGNRLEDLEELMMMEAIRLSLAAEEERKKKEEKEAAKEAKKEEKKKAKEAKKAEKAARKSSFMTGFNTDGDDDAQAGSSAAAGKGKAVDRAGGSVGFNPLSEPTSTLNTSSAREDPQKHLEESRAQIQRETSSTGSTALFDPLAEQSSHRAALRNLSTTSSSASSFAESLPGSLRQEGQGASASSFEPSPNESGVSLSRDETPPQGTPGTEPMFNFRSLAEVITTEEGKNDDDAPQHIEDVAEATKTAEEGPSSGDVNGDAPRKTTPDILVQPPESVNVPEAHEGTQKSEPESESSNALGESVLTIKPNEPTVNGDEINQSPPVNVVDSHGNHFEQKHIGNVSMVDGPGQQTTQ